MLKLLHQYTNRLILVALAVAYLVNCTTASAQITRSWNNFAGGNFNVDTNWTPLGKPGVLDTARFNSTSSNVVPIFFTNSETVEAVEATGGTFTFRGSGTTGAALRQLTAEELYIEPDASLWTLQGSDNRNFHLSITNQVSVIGALNINGGTSISTPDNTFVDDINSGAQSRIQISGNNPDGLLSTWIGERTTVGAVGEGEILVNVGGQVNLEDVVLGSEASSLGKLVVSGTGINGSKSTVNVTDSILVGRFGNGFVELTNGGQLFVPISTLGAFNGSSAEVLVSGASSSNTTHYDSDVFSLFHGSVNVEGGGLLSSRLTMLRGGEGTVTGLDSTWSTSELLEVGGTDPFQLNVQNGGRYTSQNTYIASENGTSGTIRVAGITPDQAGRFENALSMYVGGNNTSSAGTGVLEIEARGHVEVAGTLKIWDTGTVNVNSLSTLVAESIEHQNGGTFNFAGGALQVGQFHGDLVQGGTLTPGGNDVGSTFVLGDLTQQIGSKTLVEIAGVSAGIEHDLVNLSGVAFVGGSLGIRLINGFSPEPADQFNILVADNILGFYNNVANGQRLDTVDGLGSFVVNYGVGSPFDENRVVLSEFQSNVLIGDINGDGVVNLVDVEPFVEVLSSGAFIPEADINQDGAVDLLDVQAFVDLLTT